MQSQDEKFETFRSLHFRTDAFVMPNPWNAGTARILEGLGFEALATTSAGYAFSVGKRDSQGGLSREEILQNAADIVQASHLPVSADLEDGFGADPATCADTILRAIGIGLIGGSIEDTTADKSKPIHEFTCAVDRVAAAVEAAKDKPFLLTARAENYLYGRPDLADTIARLQAFSDAGADVLYAPGLPDLDAIRTVCREVDKPVNVVMGLTGGNWTVRQLSEAGVKRISVGGSFARAALGAFMRAAVEVRDEGRFTYSDQAVPDMDASAMMSDLSLSKRT